MGIFQNRGTLTRGLSGNLRASSIELMGVCLKNSQIVLSNFQSRGRYLSMQLKEMGCFFNTLNRKPACGGSRDEGLKFGSKEGSSFGGRLMGTQSVPLGKASLGLPKQWVI